MSCQDCNPGANVAIVGGDNVTVDGIGTATQPYEVNVTAVPDGDYAYSMSEDAGPDLNLSGYTLPTTVLVSKDTALGGTVTLPSWPSDVSGSLTLMITSSVSGPLIFSNLLVESGDGTGYQFITTSGGKDLLRVLWTGEEWVLTDVLEGLA